MAGEFSALSLTPTFVPQMASLYHATLRLAFWVAVGENPRARAEAFCGGAPRGSVMPAHAGTRVLPASPLLSLEGSCPPGALPGGMHSRSLSPREGLINLGFFVSLLSDVSGVFLFVFVFFFWLVLVIRARMTVFYKLFTF